MIRPSLTFIAALFFSLAHVAQAGTITGSYAPVPQGSVVDLTQTGTTDWVHWGLYTEGTVNRKVGVPARISNYQMVKPTPTSYIVAYQYSDNYNGYTWYDGTRVLAQTNTTTGVWAYQAWPPMSQSPLATGYGFQMTVPADTTTRTLKLYVGTFQARGLLRATLSDGGLAYTDSSLSNPGNGPGAVYTLVYRANSASQLLTVQWTLDQQNGTNGGGNVTLQAATLSESNANNPPLVFLESPVDGSNVAAPGVIPLSANAYDLDGTVTNVSFYQNGTLIASDQASPYEASWDNVPPGRYLVHAEASDNTGGVRSSTESVIFVHSQTGTLSASVSNPPSTVDLTAEGVADWIHLGSVTNTTLVRKANVGPEINVSTLGTNQLTRFTDAPSTFAWSDGSPISSDTGTSSGVYILGAANGFRIVTPAEPSSRKLRLYVGCYGTESKLEAYLTDFSAPAYVDRSVQGTYNSDYAVYEINYSAAAGQSLVVNFQSELPFDSIWGNVSFCAATLQGGAPQLRIQNGWFDSGTFHLSFPSESGRVYRVDYSDVTSATEWSQLTQATGNGGILTVSDSAPSTASRFYRVVAQ